MQALGDDSEPPREAYDVVLPVDPASPAFAEQLALMESMGFGAARARKALLMGRGSLEAAIEWLGAHQDEPEIKNKQNFLSAYGKGVDVRGDGGYVVAPPSIHPNGNRYEWTEKSKKAIREAQRAGLKLRPAPPELLAEFLPDRQQRVNQAVRDIQENISPGPVGEGKRHPTIVSQVGRMRRV